MNQDVISNLNLLSEKIFQTIENSVYELLDKVIDIKPDILKSEPISTIFPNHEINGIMMIANSLLLFYLIQYILTQMICLYNGKQTENMYSFLLKIIIIGILINNSYSICELVLEFFDGISTGIDIFVSSVVKKGISFDVLKENILSIENMKKVDAISVEGFIKGIISLTTISVFIHFSIRYITVIFLLIMTPIALVCLCSNLTSGISKMWFKNLFINLMMQIFFKLILLIPIAYQDIQSPIYKVIIIGSLYLLYKMNSFVNQLLSKITGGNL